jgi:membrane protein
MVFTSGIFRLNRFVTSEIWRVRRKEISRSRFAFIRFLRVTTLSVRSLLEDQCALRASALTYYSLLSLVPVLAMVMAVAKGFRFQERLEQMLLEQMEWQREIVARILDFSQAFLDTATSGIVAGIGLLLLLYTTIRILSSIEDSFNVIWKVTSARTVWRKITDYLSLMLICPVIFLVTSSLTLFVAGEVKLILERMWFLLPLGPVIFFMLRLLPYIMLWAFFTFIYIVLPNTKVHFLSGALGGVIAGTIFQLFQWGYIEFQMGVSKYNAIYGSFAALPLFFVWLQMSWLIVLLGAEISFAHQNAEKYEFEEECRTISNAHKRLLSLRVLHLVLIGFLKGENPPRDAEISHKLEIPLRLVQQILQELRAAGLVSEVRDIREPKGPGYQPSKDPELLTIKYAIQMMEQSGSSEIRAAHSRALETIAESLKVFASLVEGSPANRRLKDL